MREGVQEGGRGGPRAEGGPRVTARERNGQGKHQAG